MSNSYCFVLVQDDVYSKSGEEAQYLTFDADSKFDAVCKVADHYNIVGYDDIEADGLRFNDVCKCLQEYGDPYYICVIVHKGAVIFKGRNRVCKFDEIR